MALFKIFKGNSANLGKSGNSTQHAVEGYCYFTTDDHKFYIDIDSDATAEIGANRIALNAEYADKIVGAPTFSWVTDNTNKNIALAMQWAGHDTTQRPAILPPATLEHDGALSIAAQSIKGIKTFVNSPVFTQGTPHIGYEHYIAYPQDGQFIHKDNAEVTGLLKITLPQSWTNTMLKFKVSIYNYSNNTSVDYYISGYTYSRTPTWIAISACCVGHYGKKISNLPVSFGHDGTHCAITIGTTTTSWNYPQVTISDITLAHVDNAVYENWVTGWHIDFITSVLPTVNTTITNTNVAYYSEIANKLGTSDIGSATKPIYLKAGVPTACNDSLGVSITGNAATATKFASTQKVKLTGIVTGEVSSQAGWTVPTTIENGKITNAMLAGSIANEKLTNSKITIAGNEISLGGSLSTSTLREALGLSHAMHFIGKATVAITDGSNTDPKITGYDFATEKLPGDVIIDSGSSYEYVWVSSLDNPGNGKWERLGGDSSYKVVQSQVLDPTASGNSSTFIKTISQDTNGQITATKATVATLAIQVNGTGLQSYNASAAKTINFVQGNGITVTGAGNNITIKHTNAAVTAKTAYASTATTASADGGKIILTDIKHDAYGHITGSTDRTITLSQIKEFTISATAEDDDVVILTGTNGTNGVKYKATHKLAGPDEEYTSGNTTKNINISSVIKMPQITVDTYGHVTTASDTTLTFVKPAAGNWFNQGFVYVNSEGVAELGRFLDFHPTSESTINYSARIDAGVSTAARTLYLPDVTGEFVIHPDNTQVGATNKPIYITNTGVATAFSANIGTKTQPIYMQEGGLAASDATIGSNSKPVYLNAGVITALGATIGSTTVPVYLNQGTITQCVAAQVFSAFGSTAGTTTGETLAITVAGQNRTVTLDVASDTQAGVITNAAQTFAGVKTFKNDIVLANPAAIIASRQGGGYYEARDLALIISDTPTTTNSYMPLYSLKGAIGDFSSGMLYHSDGTEGTLQWIYITDEGYNAHTNDFTVLMTLTATGALTATSFAGNGANLTNLNASKITSGTLSANRLPASGVTAGYYGPPADNVPDHGGKIKVPYLNIDAKGRITSASTTQITLPTYTIGNAQITISAGKGLTDGGLFTTNATANKTITLAVGAGSGIVVNDNDIAVNTSYTTDGHKYALSADVISGALYTTVEQAWEDITNHTTCTINTSGTITGSKVFNAVWNDYAEFRKAEIIEPGFVVIEDASGEMRKSTERLQAGGNIISDTFGSAMGETAECQTPIAVAGRALVYTYEDRNSYPLGAAVCTGPNGTVSLMTREEVMMYPERIVGTVSEIPNYEIWGTGNIEVKGRIWVKVR